MKCLLCGEEMEGTRCPNCGFVDEYVDKYECESCGEVFFYADEVIDGLCISCFEKEEGLE